MKYSRGELQELFEKAAAAAWVDVGLRTLSERAWDKFCRSGGHELHMLVKELRKRDKESDTE